MPRALLDGELRQTDGIGGGATELLAPLNCVLDADLPQSPALVALRLTLEDGKYSRKVSFQLFKLFEDKNDNEPEVDLLEKSTTTLYINQQSSHNSALLDQKNWTMLYQETSRRDSGYSLANLYLGASLG
jgi:hypothetical protein